MKKTPLLLTIFWLCLAPAAALAQFHPDPITLNIPNVEQERNTWCWPALVQQIIRPYTYGQPPSQCELAALANEDRGLATDCCQDPAQAECDRLGSIPEIMSLARRYGGQVRQVALPDRPEEIYDYLAAGEALIVGFRATPESDHAYLVKGLSWSGDEARLVINDPAVAGEQTFAFQEIRPSWFVALAAK